MSSVNRSTISAYLICHNEERQIRRCLASVAWCDEIIVVDSGSTDRTVEIAREFTDQVIHHDWPGYVEQKAYALSLCAKEWALSIDSDEEVSPEMRKEILHILEEDKAGRVTVNGFLFNRVVYFLNRWWRRGGWYPEFRLRLGRRAEKWWGGENPHDKAFVKGKTKRCKGVLYHYSFSDLTDYVRRGNALSSISANTLVRKNARFSLFKLIGSPIARFVKFYLVKRGFLEGVAGFVIAASEAHSVLLKYAKLWEAQTINKTDDDQGSVA